MGRTAACPPRSAARSRSHVARRARALPANAARTRNAYAPAPWTAGVPEAEEAEDARNPARV